MAEKPTRDAVLRRMLKTPPTPHDQQPKVRKRIVESRLVPVDEGQKRTKDRRPKTNG